MPNMNINAGASGNPLDSLLGNNPLWGSLGGLLFGTPGNNMPGATDEAGNPLYGAGFIYGNNPEWTSAYNALQNYNGKGAYTQLRNTNVGGPGGVIDPSLVTYDPKYGEITPTTNLNPLGQGTLFDQYGGFIMLGGAMGAGILGAGAGAGAGAGTDLTNLGATGGLSPETVALNTAGAGAGVGGAGAAGGGMSLGAGGLDPETLAGAGGMSSATDGIGAVTGGGGLGNTLSTLNRVRQGLSLVNSLFGGGGNTQTGGGMGGNSILDLLGLLGLGRSGGLFGGGLGTPGGAQAAGQASANAADPWGASGLRTQSQQMLTPQVMMQLLGLNPNGTQTEITNDPAYKFALSQGTAAINQGDAAQGTLHSGNRLTELEKYGTGLSASFENQYRTENLQSLDALSNMSGLGSSSPTAAAEALMAAFTGGSSLQNNALSNLFGGLSNGAGGGLGGLFSGLGSLGSGIGSFFSSLFGGGNTSGMTDSEISALISGVGGGNTSDSLFGGISSLFGAGAGP